MSTSESTGFLRVAGHIQVVGSAEGRPVTPGLNAADFKTGEEVETRAFYDRRHSHGGARDGTLMALCAWRNVR
jgi:hypothetical protein